MVTKTKTDLKFTTTDESGTKSTTTISYVNPELSDDLCIELTQKFAALTTDIYGSTTRVTTEELAFDG